jgi:hypothetical protein
MFFGQSLTKVQECDAVTTERAEHPLLLTLDGLFKGIVDPLV